MARLEGITGGLSGKMGSAVFRQSGGKTIASQYQPVVKNPNTEGQQNTRAAFKLMSQLAAVMKNGFGTMGINERPARGRMSQRNAFFKLNYPLVVVSEDNSSVTAKIPMEKVQLTSSFRDLPSPELAATANGFDIDFLNIPSDVTTIRVVVVNYTNNIPGIARMIDYPKSTGSANISASVENLPAGAYTVLAYGLIPSESAKSSIDLDNIHTPSDENFISAVELDYMVAKGLMAETKTVGANVTVTGAGA